MFQKNNAVALDPLRESFVTAIDEYQRYACPLGLMILGSWHYVFLDQSIQAFNEKYQALANVTGELNAHLRLVNEERFLKKAAYEAAEREYKACPTPAISAEEMSAQGKLNKISEKKDSVTSQETKNYKIRQARIELEKIQQMLPESLRNERKHHAALHQAVITSHCALTFFMCDSKKKHYQLTATYNDLYGQIAGEIEVIKANTQAFISQLPQCC